MALATFFSTALALAALAAPQVGAPIAVDPTAEDPSGEPAAGAFWEVLEVPLGSALDLVRGAVVAAAPADGRPFLRGPLEAFQGNVLLSPAPSPARMFGAPDPSAAQGTPYFKGLAEGEGLLWTLGDTWGFVRLLEHGPQAARLEVGRAPAGVAALVRAPAALSVDADPTGFTLRFDSEGLHPGPWRIERRELAAGAPFVEVATVAASPFTDVDAARDRPHEWRVRRALAPAAPGALGRSVRTVTPGEWPVPLTVGVRLDLLTGALDGARAHLEVTQVSGETVVLKPLRATLVAPSSPKSGWRLVERASFDPSAEGRLRSFQAGSELCALTPEGVIVRVELVRAEGGGVALLRQPALAGERLLPRAPIIQIEHTPAGVTVVAAPLAPDVERPEEVALTLERELVLGRGDWVVIAEGAPGARRLDAPLATDSPAGAQSDASAPPLARLRARQRYAFGPQSFPTEPRTLVLVPLADAARRAAFAEAAIADLDHEDWQRRDAARRLLEALGPEVLPRLRAVLESGSPEARISAQALLAGVSSSAGRALLYGVEAARRGVADEVPQALLSDSPTERAFGIVRALEAGALGADGEARAAALVWAAVLAEHDTDRAVRAYCDMLVALHEAGAPGTGAEGLLRGELAALRGRDGGAPAWSLQAATADIALPDDARSLWQRLRAQRALDLADLEVGPVLGAVLAHVARAARAPEAGLVLPDYDVDSVDLALRLVARYGVRRDARLLDAARGLFVEGGALDWQVALEGWRAAVAARLADESVDLSQRPVFHVRGVGGAPATLDDLETLLTELRQSGARDVDVVLPPGDLGEGNPGRWLELDVPGLRLRSQPNAEPARLRCGVRVMAARGVVLDGVHVEHHGGAALLVLDGAHLVLRGGSAFGTGMGVQVQDADLELYSAEVGDASSGRSGQWAARHLGRGRIVARGVHFRGGSVYLGDFGDSYFERCVFDAGERPVLQAQRDGRPVLRECFARSSAMGLVNVSGGCLAAVVLDVPRDPFGPRPDGLAVDPRWFVLTGPGQSVPQALRLARSPLE